jgi:hypothetical protein
LDIGGVGVGSSWFVGLYGCSETGGITNIFNDSVQALKLKQMQFYS